MKSTSTTYNPQNHYQDIGICTVKSIKRKKRKEALRQYWQGENFTKYVLPLISDKEIAAETLKQKELQCGTTFYTHQAERSKGEYISSVGHYNHSKYDKQLMSDLNISTTDPTQIAERILQLTKKQMSGEKGVLTNANTTLVGYVSVEVKINEEKTDTTIYPVIIGWLGSQYGNRWGIDCQIGVPWTNGLRILQNVS